MKGGADNGLFECIFRVWWHSQHWHGVPSPLFLSGTKKKAKDDKSDTDEKNEADSAEEDGDDNADNDEKSDTKKTSEKKKPAANNDKKKPDGKKDDAKSNSKNSNDKKDDDGAAKPSDKKESAMSLGEIARIDSYITNTKVDALQVLHSVSRTRNFKFALGQLNWLILFRV